MKKILVLLAATVLVITACNNGSNKFEPAPDSPKTPVPVDTVKIDTVKPTDSIIKG